MSNLFSLSGSWTVLYEYGHMFLVSGAGVLEVSALHNTFVQTPAWPHVCKGGEVISILAAVVSDFNPLQRDV